MAADNVRFAFPSDEVGNLASVSMTTNTADASYPASLISDWTNENETKPAKASATGAAAWVYDFTTARRIDWIVVWHNFDAGINVRFQGNATNSWGGPTLDAAVVIPARTQDGFTVKVFTDLTAVSGYSTTGFRYWRLSVPSATVAAGVKIMAFSVARTLVNNIHRAPRQPYRRNAIVHRTDFNHTWAYDLPSPRRSVSFHMEATATDLATMKNLFMDAGGSVKPFAFVLNPLVNDAMIVRFDPGGTDGLITELFDLTLIPVASTRSPINLTVEELTAGLPEWT